MKDHIVQEVRDARAAVAADFGFDLNNFFAWAKEQSAAESKAKHWLPIQPKGLIDAKVATGATKVGKRPARSLREKV